MDFKKTFIDLTQWVVPHGYEETIVHLLPKGCQKDKKGNYFITIGESETLFTCHLDTVSQRAKITHVFEDNWIKTDGTTILGGDNKAGVCILMYLIEQQVPGTYYFFVGEECGRLGSKWALENDTEYFKKFKRAIAFDRRNRGSIITHQSSRLCASPEFTEALSKEMNKSGLEYKGDSGGSYTDTYTFIDVISECTNLSASVVGEHTTSEKVNIVHLEEIAKASSKVEWEKLPSARDLSKKEWKSYNSGYSGSSYSGSSYSGSSEYSDYYEDYENCRVINLPQPKKNVSECGLDFTILNVDKFFNLKKVVDSEDIYFTTDDGLRNFYFNFDNNVVAIEEDLGQKYPYIQQHFVQKTNVPTTFEELWKAIEKMNLSFIPKFIQNVIPFYSSYITEYFDLEETFDDHENRLLIDPLTNREFQFEIDIKWVGIWEVLSTEPYLKPIYSNDNNFSNFAELWVDIREYVPFRRKGTMENIFYNGGTKIKSYNKIIDITDTSSISFKDSNIDKFFDLVKVKGDSKTDVEYFKAPNGKKLYFIEISPNCKVYLWEKESGQASIIHGVSFLSFEQLWTFIKDKVEFQPKEDLDQILAKLDEENEISFKEENIENFFNLTRNEQVGSRKSLYFTSEHGTPYFFKLIEDDSTIYLVDLSGQMSTEKNATTHIILDYVKFKSFEQLWNTIKDKVDFAPIVKEGKEKKVKNIDKIAFNNDNVIKYFDLMDYSRRNKHYVTSEGVQYYFDILDDNVVYLWERTTGKFNTIIDGEVYNSFGELWEDVGKYLKFKKRVPEILYTQDNITRYFNLVSDVIRSFYYDKETGENYFIYCGGGRNKVAIKRVHYKDGKHPKTGIRQISRMDNLYFSGDSDKFETFDELWEVIKDKVPFKKR